MDTPVPIPNTEVKHRSGEGIQLVGENSALPGFFFILFIYFSIIVLCKKIIISDKIFIVYIKE